MTKTAQATRTVWPTLPVAQLLADAPAVEAPADLIESIAANGFEDPLYVATLGTGAARVVDGLRRLAAAAALNLTDVPVTYRPLIRVTALTRHPGNVRENLKITAVFRASVREHMDIPIKITRAGDTLRVIDGHRRLAAALAEKMTHVPYEYEERDEASQYLTMVSTAVHREGLTQAEEAAALFSAAELGAGIKRLSAASGLKQADVKARIKVGGSAAVAAVTGSSYAFSFEDLTKLAELEQTAPDAAQRVRDAVAADPKGNHYWTIRNESSRAETDARAAQHRVKLLAEGAAIRTETELSPKATPVHALRGVSDHSTCQGDVWVLEAGDPHYTRYCTNPPFFGHELGANGKPTASERKGIITGNQHWDTACAIRQEWLAETIGAKAPKARVDQFLTIVTRVMLGASPVIASKLNSTGTSATLAVLLGLSETGTDRRALAARADKGTRNPSYLFAVVAAAFEDYMPRSTWRTDGQYARADEYGHAGTRNQGALYLGWLIGLGYEPTAVEAAVVAGEPYNPAAVAVAADPDSIK